MPNRGRVFHYTAALGMAGIARDMHIRAERCHTPPNERPVVWFSKATFEPTIGNVAYELPSGRMLWLRGPAQFRLMGLGLYRLGVPALQLLHYPELVKRAGIRAARLRHQAQYALTCGSYPHHWMGSLEDISIADNDIEFDYHDGLNWVRSNIFRARDLVRDQREEIVPQMEAFLKRSDLDEPEPRAANAWR